MRALRPHETADLTIVGAGIVGLAHAVDAVRRGLSVVIVERDQRPIGASVRNFGHACVTAQSGPALEFALRARTTWLELSASAGFWARECGTVVVARAADELAVLAELADSRPEHVRLLSPSEVERRVGDLPSVVGGAFLPLDLRVDPRTAAPAIAAWLVEQGVDVRWGTTAHLLEPGLVVTSRGEVRTRATILATGHDLDRHYPELAADTGVRRCTLHMLRVAAPNGRRIDPALLTGSSLLRYSAFTACPSAALVRDRLRSNSPELFDADVNLMLTQAPNGDLIIGDTHDRAVTPSPFQREPLDDLLLGHAAALLGATDLVVRERWRGVYASAPDQEFLVGAPADRIRAVSVVTGIGMTTAFGLARTVLDELLA